MKDVRKKDVRLRKKRHFIQTLCGILICRAASSPPVSCARSSVANKMWRFLPLFALQIGVSHAEVFETCWTDALTNIDGTPYENVDTTTVQYGACFAGEAIDPISIGAEVLHGTICATIDIIVPGDWCLNAYHTNVLGVPSELSNTAVFRIMAPAAPAQPGPLVVTTLFVYEAVPRPNKNLFVFAGTIKADTVCDYTQPIGGFFDVVGEPFILYMVDKDAVDYGTSTVRPDTVYASCE
jgi:hypothetical protein